MTLGSIPLSTHYHMDQQLCLSLKSCTKLLTASVKKKIFRVAFVLMTHNLCVSEPCKSKVAMNQLEQECATSIPQTTICPIKPLPLAFGTHSKIQKKSIRFQNRQTGTTDNRQVRNNKEH